MKPISENLKIDKKDIIYNLSLNSSYHQKPPTSYYVKENLFNKSIFDYLNSQSSYFNTGITRGAIYATCTVFYVESLNSFLNLNFENILNFLKAKNILNNEKETSNFKALFSLVNQYIEDFKTSIKNKKFINSKNISFFGSQTNYENIPQLFFHNLESFNNFILKKDIGNNELFPGYKLNNKEHLLSLSPFVIKYLLKSLSQANWQQVAVDLNRMDVYIAQKKHEYHSSDTEQVRFEKFLFDLHKIGIKKKNIIQYISEYAHQGALLAGWSMPLLKQLALSNKNVSNAEDLILNFESINDTTIRISSVFTFKIRDLDLPDFPFLNFSKNIGLYFSNIFKFPEIGIFDEVLVLHNELAIVNANDLNPNDRYIITQLKHNILSLNKMNSYSVGDKLNKTKFNIK
ncbi:hypothetical protein QEJ31_15660 [Pigmentibacter sp. JX0631]|uniref:hypothetical protein n=1 Tax=Pigmentibacter sp. JX0631 TaxID=2976982 RepID=UPI00246879AD|nr:hypothetical protein [Pigmentibacter sp. JX0631]WGL59969.1 hypothetical protein QEJ31_15660 [Pigmentibacter sp. JX0631]